MHITKPILFDRKGSVSAAINVTTVTSSPDPPPTPTYLPHYRPHARSLANSGAPPFLYAVLTRTPLPKIGAKHF